MISADSHLIAGSYTFAVGAPSPGLLVGAALVLARLWPRRLDRRAPRRVIWLGAGRVAAASVAEMLLQVPYVAGGGLAGIRAADVREVVASQYGARST